MRFVVFRHAFEAIARAEHRVEEEIASSQLTDSVRAILTEPERAELSHAGAAAIMALLQLE